MFLQGLYIYLIIKINRKKLLDVLMKRKYFPWKSGHIHLTLRSKLRLLSAYDVCDKLSRVTTMNVNSKRVLVVALPRTNHSITERIALFDVGFQPKNQSTKAVYLQLRHGVEFRGRFYEYYNHANFRIISVLLTFMLNDVRYIFLLEIFLNKIY